MEDGSEFCRQEEEVIYVRDDERQKTTVTIRS